MTWRDPKWWLDPMMFDLTNPSARFFWMWNILGLWVLWNWFGLKHAPSLIWNVLQLFYYVVRTLFRVIKNF